MADKTICQTCCNWVDCTKTKPEGFCLLKDLFTYTAEKKCLEYKEGKPLTEEEWEDFNYAEFSRL